MAEKWVTMDKEDAADAIGQSLHTALRKVVDTPEAGPLWQAISKTGDTWEQALDGMMGYLDMMNIRIQEKV